MIDRYSRPEMVNIWSQQSKFRIWYEIEAYACEAMEQIGLVPEGTRSDVLKASGVDYDIDEIDTIEKVTKQSPNMFPQRPKMESKSHQSVPQHIIKKTHQKNISKILQKLRKKIKNNFVLIFL